MYTVEKNEALFSICSFEDIMVGNPIPHSLKSEAKKAAKILRDFTMPSAKTGIDKTIPGMNYHDYMAIHG